MEFNELMDGNKKFEVIRKRILRYLTDNTDPTLRGNLKKLTTSLSKIIQTYSITTERHIDKAGFENREFVGDRYINYKISKLLFSRLSFLNSNLSIFNNIIVSNKNLSIIYDLLEFSSIFTYGTGLNDELSRKQKADIVESVIGELNQKNEEPINKFLEDFINFVYFVGMMYWSYNVKGKKIEKVVAENEYYDLFVLKVIKDVICDKEFVVFSELYINIRQMKNIKVKKRNLVSIVTKYKKYFEISISVKKSKKVIDKIKLIDDIDQFDNLNVLIDDIKRFIRENGGTRNLDEIILFRKEINSDLLKSIITYYSEFVIDDGICKLNDNFADNECKSFVDMIVIENLTELVNQKITDFSKLYTQMRSLGVKLKKKELRDNVNKSLDYFDIYRAPNSNYIKEIRGILKPNDFTSHLKELTKKIKMYVTAHPNIELHDLYARFKKTIRSERNLLIILRVKKYKFKVTKKSTCYYIS